MNINLENIFGRLYCDRAGHDRMISALCLDLKCTEKRYICPICVKDGLHRQHKASSVGFDQLKDFIHFYSQPDKLNQRLRIIFQDYRQRIVTHLAEIDDLVHKIVQQRDIGTLNNNFLSTDRRSLSELDHYAYTLSKLIKQSNGKVERDNQFFQDFEVKLSQFYQSLIKQELDCLSSLVSSFSQFTLIQVPANLEPPRSKYGLSIRAFERFIFSRRYISPKIQWKDDFIVRGVGTAILEPSLDYIYYNQIQVRLQLTVGLLGSIGICTVNEQNANLMSKVFLAQSDGYLLNSNNPSQNYQKRAFGFTYQDVLYLNYNRDQKSLAIAQEKNKQQVLLTGVEDKEDLYFCVILHNSEICILNV